MFDDARTGESDQSAGLADIQVAEHGEAGGHAAGRRICQHRNVGHLCIIETRQRRRYLRELHEADGAFHHAGAARAGDNNKRLARVHGQLHSARDLLSDHRAHGSADEVELHRADDDRPARELALGGDHCIIHPEFLARFLEPRRVRLRVDELQRVSRGHARVVLGPAAVEQHLQTLLGVHFEMEAAFRADEQIRFKILTKDDGAARLALHP